MVEIAIVEIELHDAPIYQPVISISKQLRMIEVAYCHSDAPIDVRVMQAVFVSSINVIYVDETIAHAVIAQAHPMAINSMINVENVYLQVILCSMIVLTALAHQMVPKK